MLSFTVCSCTHTHTHTHYVSSLFRFIVPFISLLFKQSHFIEIYLCWTKCSVSVFAICTSPKQNEDFLFIVLSLFCLSVCNIILVFIFCASMLLFVCVLFKNCWVFLHRMSVCAFCWTACTFWWWWKENPNRVSHRISCYSILLCLFVCSCFFSIEMSWLRKRCILRTVGKNQMTIRDCYWKVIENYLFVNLCRPFFQRWPLLMYFLFFSFSVHYKTNYMRSTNLAYISSYVPQLYQISDIFWWKSDRSADESLNSIEISHCWRKQIKSN